MSSSDNVTRLPHGPIQPPNLEALDVEESAMRKVTLRLLPFLFLLYMLNILDRNNVGFAKLDMLRDLGISEYAFGIGAGVCFYVGYFFFEVPSNLVLRKTGARRWIGRIMISWGIISASMMFVKNQYGFYLLRALLGIAEAGFFPGIILYVSYWFPARRRARAVANFMTASAITGIIGSPLSGGIMQYLDGVGHLTGWQWLFLLEGLPSILVGFITLWYLTDNPGLAAWLTPKERGWLEERMRGEENLRLERHGFTIMQALRNRRVWHLCLLYFAVATGSTSYGIYAPTIIEWHFFEKQAVPFQTASTVALVSAPLGDGQFLAASAVVAGRAARSNKFLIGLLLAIPSIVAVIAMVLVAKHSDHTGERRWHIAIPAFCAAIGWVMVAHLESKYLVMVGMTLALAGMMSMLPTFWSLPTSFLSGAAAAGGIALINSVGNLGGAVGPYVFGQVQTMTNSYSGAIYFLSGILCVGAFLAMSATHDRKMETTS